jgi:predicted ferric reductase
MSVFWLATRATGEVALVLLTIVTVLGIATTKGWAHERWPESVVTLVHRNVSLLSIVFLVVHIATTVIDGYVPISWVDVFIPGQTSYQTLWVGLGTVALDLLIAVIITSLLRHRMPQRAWKAIHWTAYALWASAIVHSLGVGTDKTLTRLVAITMVTTVALAFVARFFTPDRSDDPGVTLVETQARR